MDYVLQKILRLASESERPLWNLLHSVNLTDAQNGELRAIMNNLETIQSIAGANK